LNGAQNASKLLLPSGNRHIVVLAFRQTLSHSRDPPQVFLVIMIIRNKFFRWHLVFHRLRNHATPDPPVSPFPGAALIRTTAA